MSKNHIKQCGSCIHARVCYLKANRENYTGVLKMTPCDHYKSESNTLDLPCSIGDKVYILVFYKGGIVSHYKTKTCTGIHITRKAIGYRGEVDSYYLVVNSDIGRAEHIPFHEIGKKVFFSEEEVKKVLEEKYNEFKNR